MIVIPKVARVSPRCCRCNGDRRLILGDGPVVCRDCVHMCVRLAGVSRIVTNDDGTVRE